MKTSLICLCIAIAFRVALSQSVEIPSAWLTIQDHSKSRMTATDISSDPCYTDIICKYKPIAHKLSDGRWEITFTSEVAQELP